MSVQTTLFNLHHKEDIKTSNPAGEGILILKRLLLFITNMWEAFLIYSGDEQRETKPH